MKNIGKNIHFEEHTDSLYIEIKPSVDKNKYNLTLIWFIAWTVCGIAVASQLFVDIEKNQKLFIIIFLVFWAYFEYQVLNALRWRKSGKEIVSFKNNNLHYVKEIGGRGLEKIYETNSLSSFVYVGVDETSFLSFVNQSNWMPGNEVVEFKSGDKTRRLGIQLSSTDADMLTKKINQFLKKQSK